MDRDASRKLAVALNEDFTVSNSEGPFRGLIRWTLRLKNSIRGQMSIPSYTLPAFPGDSKGSVLGFVFVLAADGKSGNIEERDAGGSVISGKLYAQDSTAFSIASLAGNFAFGAATAFNGNQASNDNWQAMVGRFTLSSEDASFQSGLIDTAVAQTGPGLKDAVLDGGWTAPDSEGQMNMNVFPTGSPQLFFIAIVVNASKVLFVEMDNTETGNSTIYAGSATHQAALTTASLNGASVFSGPTDRKILRTWDRARRRDDSCLRIRLRRAWSMTGRTT